MLTTSASVKRRLSSEHLQSQNYRGMTTTCCPGSNMFILVRLRTGHNRLNSHMHRKLKLAPSSTCPCGREEQTVEHVLQRCPLYEATREDVWPVSTSLTTKLYGCKQELEKTTSFISRAALIVQTANAKKKKNLKKKDPVEIDTKGRHSSLTFLLTGQRGESADQTGTKCGLNWQKVRNKLAESAEQTGRK